MSFAALRQRVVQAHLVNLARFGETVQIGAPDDAGNLLEVRVKIEHDTLLNRKGNTMAGSGNESRQSTLDERERIQVTVSRDPAWPYAYPRRPAPATALYRSEARDVDRRPFTFRGEIVYEGDQHAVYVFERPRRVVQGKAM